MWNDKIDVGAGVWYTVGLKSSGTVITTGDMDDSCDLEN